MGNGFKSGRDPEIIETVGVLAHPLTNIEGLLPAQKHNSKEYEHTSYQQATKPCSLTRANGTSKSSTSSTRRKYQCSLLLSSTARPNRPSLQSPAQVVLLNSLTPKKVLKRSACTSPQSLRGKKEWRFFCPPEVAPKKKFLLSEEKRDGHLFPEQIDCIRYLSR